MPPPTAHRPADDPSLLARLRGGDELAFRHFVEQYQNRVFSTIRNMVSDAGEAEDLTQETFVEVYLNIENFRAEARLSTWIYRIAVNKALGHLRAKRAKKRFGQLLSIFHLAPADEKPDWEHPGHLLEKKESAERLAAAVETLPGQQKTAFVLRQSEELSYAEIAEVMQVSVPSVESLLFRAKQNLKKKLDSGAG